MSQKPSVLVVDDESGILDTLRILLRNEGFEVTTAQGGKAGLEQIRAGAHDIILSDVRMPQVSGLDILTAAREQDPMTPVILMTAQASLQSAISAVNAGAFYYIQKPFSNDELVAILRRACEFRAVRVENKQLKQEIRRRDKTAVTRPIGKSKRFLERAQAGGARGADRLDRADPGRERHRQGSHRPLHPQPLHPGRRAVPVHQLRRAAREPARERAVRPREGLVHRRGAGQAGALRRRARRHLLPRRGRRDAAVAPGEAAARAPGARGDPGRRHRGDPGRRAHHRRDQPRPRGGDPPRQLPLRPLLPAQRHRAPPAAAARPARRPAAPARGVPPERSARRAAASPKALAVRGAGRGDGVRVARQRARAGERAGARRGAQPRQPDRGRARCRSGSPSGARSRWWRSAPTATRRSR